MTNAGKIMFLYHYSTQRYDSLQSKRKSGTASLAEIELSEEAAKKCSAVYTAYVDSISFLFDPVPAVVLSRIFGTNHPVWATGNKLYEYAVAVDSLPEIIPFDIKESVNKTHLMDKFVEKFNWVEHDPSKLRKWRALEATNKLKWGEFGTTRDKLIEQIKEHGGHLDKAFMQAYARDDFEENRMKYAANVPHVMLYPKTGEINYTTISTLTIGNNRRTLIE